MQAQTTPRLPFVWDYDIHEDDFLAILEGRITIGKLDQDWAAIRLLEYAPYQDIIRLMGFTRLVGGWARWRSHIRSVSRKRGLDFLTAYIPSAHPELLHD